MPVGVLLLVLAAPPAGSRSYRVFVDGQEDGAARLSVRPGVDGGLAYEWDSQIGLSREPCLRSEEHVAGVYAPGQPVPDEWAISLGTHPAGARSSLGEDGLPDRVELSGIVYQAAPPAAVRWDRCWPRGLSGGLAVRIPAGDPAPRRLSRAVFSLAFSREDNPVVVTRRGHGPLPGDVAAAIAAAYRDAPGRDCKAVARDLARALRARGLDARVEGGLLLDGGRLWPHAWTRVRVGDTFRDVDATTGTSWADAGRLDVGPLEGPGAWRTGLDLLHLRRAHPALLSFAVAPASGTK